MSKTVNGEHDGAWEAFRYVANEMTSTEEAAFESRLDRDQSARESVAEVVRLTAVVRGAFREGANPQETPPTFLRAGRLSYWALPAGWMSLGAAACLLLMAGLNGGRSSGRVPAPEPASVEGRQVALAWSQVVDDLPAEPARDDPFAESSVDGDTTSPALNEDTDWDTPGWLAAALSEVDTSPAADMPVSPAPTDQENL